jgi:hypothetical protein
MPREVWVESSDDEKAKTRSFRGVVFATVHADGIWETGRAAKDVVRPLCSVIGADDAEAGPLMANLRLGRKFGDRPPNTKADTYKFTTYEFVRSASYRWKPQRHPEGAIYQVFVPDLYAADPGMVDPDRCTFALLPALSWLDAYPLDIDAMIDHQRGMTPRREDELPDDSEEMRVLARIAPLWLVYLDRRTTCPLVPDPRFALQLLVAGLAADVVTRGNTMKTYGDRKSWGRGMWSYEEEGLADMKFAPGLATNVEHKVLEPFLADQVARYYKRTSLHAALSTAVRAGRGQEPLKAVHGAFRVGVGASPGATD